MPSFACDNHMESHALFQNIFQFCRFLDFCPNFQIFCSFCLFFWKITCVPLLSRTGSVCILIRIHSMQDWAATTRHGVARKRSTRILQRIPESSFVRKETVEHSLAKYRKGDRKIMQSLWIMSQPPTRIRKWD